jgi:hypothetical protein
MPYFDPSQRDETFSRIGARLAADVDAATERLQRLGEREASEPRAPGKWSPKEILGHLIDSASNNHQRFIRAQLAQTLRLPGYEQERWVVTQRYREQPWLDLVQLWSWYNRHLAHVIAAIPENCRHTSCEIGSDPPVTLAHVALDYVGHIQHHLRQIFR